MASIRDVAKRANVAACTVSRVLNGTANVAPETRMKIEQAMKELNYIPNELARSMFKQKAGIVAMLVPDIRHPYFSSLARHIEDELYKNDCKLMLCSTGDDPDHLTAAGQETSEYDAAFRWREGSDSNRTSVCNPEPETVTILSSGRD